MCVHLDFDLQATSRDAKNAQKEHLRTVRAEAKEAEKRAEVEVKERTKAKKGRTGNVPKSHPVKGDKSQVSKEGKLRSAALAEMEAVHLDLIELCRE